MTTSHLQWPTLIHTKCQQGFSSAICIELSAYNYAHMEPHPYRKCQAL